MISRRMFSLGLTASATSMAVTPTFAQSGPQFPDPSTFQAGDLVWPKSPGAYIPYNYDLELSPAKEMRLWEQEKEQFLGQLGGQTDPTAIALRHRLQSMTFQEFRDEYLRGVSRGSIVLYETTSIVATGHVGIIELDEGNAPFVIEAIMSDAKSVVRTPYDSWKRKRRGEIVWHGRLRGFDKSQRASIAKAASAYIGKPYQFFNFDLANEEGFYCSKLVWLSTMKALNTAIDGNTNPKRFIWLSPKQILYSPLVQRLVDPGWYAFD